MILSLFEQDVQISGTKTGSLVCATLRNHETVRVSEGYDIVGVFFSWVLHFLDNQKRSASPLKGESYTVIEERSYGEIKSTFQAGCIRLDSCMRRNDGPRLEINTTKVTQIAPTT